MRLLLVRPEDFMSDFTEKHLLVRPQVRRRFLSDEGFSVEKRHLAAPRPPAAERRGKREGNRGRNNDYQTQTLPQQVKVSSEMIK